MQVCGFLTYMSKMFMIIKPCEFDCSAIRIVHCSLHQARHELMNTLKQILRTYKSLSHHSGKM